MLDRSALRRHSLCTLLGILAVACSGGGGGGSGTGFEVTISVMENQEVRLNQELVFTFSAPVDFSTVSQNTINIRSTAGNPATGSFSPRGANRVVFQPSCPTLADLSNGGLQLGGQYEIVVFGSSGGATNTVRSTSGASLGFTQSRRFHTPTAPERDQAFIDPFPSLPPTPVVRSEGSTLAVASYMEVGGDPNNRVYFERDALQNVVLSVPGFEAPLNLYSDASTELAFIIQLNQAVDPSPVNVSSETMRLEYLQDVGGNPTWLPIETTVTLESNCTAAGARVRLTPVGVLPSGTQIRAVILTGLQDLVGEATAQDNSTFAVAPTAPIAFANLSPVDALSDELDEGFDFGGTSSRSRQDVTAPFAAPDALWQRGRLTAAFDFQGDGGPGGAFDWVVAGQDFVLDTTQALLTAPDNTVQDVQGGVVQVRNLTIADNATVRVVGPNPLVIYATGTVTIRGRLDLSGSSAPNVVGPDSGNVREIGAPGNAGGGRGGDANLVTTNSSAVGGTGQGPFGLANAGGKGGETAFARASDGPSARYPGGGGGGRFAADQGPSSAGLAAQGGSNGTATAQSAVNASRAPLGGQAGAGPFTKAGTTDDFFGSRAEVSGGMVTQLIRGELPSLWAGYGGGGGGNANPATVFPTPSWTPSSDEKGGAGGGGGGGLRIRALGPIVFGPNGDIRTVGGTGAKGESILNEDRVGGSGASGSGGHVVLETAAYIDFGTEGGTVLNGPNRDWISARGGPTVPRAAVGGQPSAGGAGGPGVIQLHVPDVITGVGIDPLSADIVVPLGAFMASNPYDAVATPPAILAIPSFGSKSMARSRWVSVGAADQKPGGVTSLVEFLFGGIETSGPDAGKVLVDGTDVRPVTALLDEDLEGSATLSILADRVTLEIRGTSLDTAFVAGTTAGVSNDVYLRNPRLLEGFDLRLELAEDPDVFRDFDVVRGTFDEGSGALGDEVLTVTVATSGGQDLQGFFNANTGAGTIHVRLIQRFFRVFTGQTPDMLTASSYVRLRFQAARDDGLGAPDESSPLVDWTSDITDFNAVSPGELQFFRFEVEFELADGAPLLPTTEPVALDFLRIPFRF